MNNYSIDGKAFETTGTRFFTSNVNGIFYELTKNLLFNQGAQRYFLNQPTFSVGAAFTKITSDIGNVLFCI